MSSMIRCCARAALRGEGDVAPAFLQ